MKKGNKPTPLQQAFGEKYGNNPVITARPEGMPYNEYRKIRAAQTKFIRKNHVS